MEQPVNITPPEGKLGILIVGLNGAVSTAFVAGTLAVQRNLASPIGSLAQMATIRLGKRFENRFPLIREFVPLADISSFVFGGWDIREENCYKSAQDAQVLEEHDLQPLRTELEQIRPLPGIFEQRFVPRLNGNWIKRGSTKYDMMEQLRKDLQSFRKEHDVERTVMLFCASTEIYLPIGRIYQDPISFEDGMKANDPAISPSMLYAYAAISEKVPFVNGTPNLSADIPALMELALEQRVPIAGKDLKTGQTLIKTVIAPMLKARMLGLRGWFSSNLLGNRDGEVLDDPGCFKAKEESKLSVLDGILQPELYPVLYGKYCHQVRIHYYPPRGDNKEGWDNIDIFGWLGYPMQLKINFLCRDSILAAPLALDLALFIDLAQRSDFYGVQDWLSFYFKHPMHSAGAVPEHDLFIQLMKLKNTLRILKGGQPITHLDGVE
jgi:myo-inositol-1-phosphate synthase